MSVFFLVFLYRALERTHTSCSWNCIEIISVIQANGGGEWKREKVLICSNWISTSHELAFTCSSQRIFFISQVVTLRVLLFTLNQIEPCMSQRIYKEECLRPDLLLASCTHVLYQSYAKIQRYQNSNNIYISKVHKSRCKTVIC